MKKNKILWVIVLLVITNGITFYISKNKLHASHHNPSYMVSEPTASENDCDIKITRLDGYKLVRPLLFTDTYYQSEGLTPLKKNLENLLLQTKQAGEIINASVYIKDYEDGDWTGINENQRYYPGSLSKVPVLITYLKMEEQTPGILNKKYFIDKPLNNIPSQTFTSKEIAQGNTYTVKELLKYMVAYSDNKATDVLIKFIDKKIFAKLFLDLGLPEPPENDIDFKLSSREYSLFLRIIYNSAYLSMPHSEYAAELMSESDFKDGFKDGIPKNISMAHKFGESGNSDTHQLHESGFIYANNHTFLLTVMTEGEDINKLSSLLSKVAKLTYKFMTENPSTTH